MMLHVMFIWYNTFLAADNFGKSLGTAKRISLDAMM